MNIGFKYQLKMRELNNNLLGIDEAAIELILLNDRSKNIQFLFST